MLNVCDVTSLGMSLIRISHNPSSVIEFKLILGKYGPEEKLVKHLNSVDMSLLTGWLFVWYKASVWLATPRVIHNSYKYYTIHQFHCAHKIYSNQICIINGGSAVFQMKQCQMACRLLWKHCQRLFITHRSACKHQWKFDCFNVVRKNINKPQGASVMCLNIGES